MKIIKLLATIYFLGSVNQNAFCQNQRFTAGIIAGCNFNYNYLHSIGVNAGVLGSIKLSENKQLGIEILYTQKGQYNSIEYVPPEYNGSTWGTYVEIPVHFDWLFYLFRYEDFYDLNLSAGMAYARNVGVVYSEKNINKEEFREQIVYNRLDNLLLQVGATYNFSETLGINFKASVPLLHNELFCTYAARMIYTFN